MISIVACCHSVKLATRDFRSQQNGAVTRMWRSCQVQPSEKEPCCCDQKSRVASAQSFTLWQQATIEIMRCDHSIIACLRHTCMGVIFRAPPVRGESNIQCNGTREIVTVQPHIGHFLRRTIESNPGQGLVKYECVVTFTCPQTNTVTSGHLVTK